MSLTTEAYAKRIWEGYLVLRTLLERQKLSDRYEVWSTADETQSEYLQNLLRVYQLLDSYAEVHDDKVFGELHSEPLRSMMVEDLHRLEDRLIRVSKQFSEMATRVAKLRKGN
jgi:hypothetical protein